MTLVRAFSARAFSDDDDDDDGRRRGKRKEKFQVTNSLFFKRRFFIWIKTLLSLSFSLCLLSDVKTNQSPPPSSLSLSLSTFSLLLVVVICALLALADGDLGAVLNGAPTDETPVLFDSSRDCNLLALFGAHR